VTGKLEKFLTEAKHLHVIHFIGDVNKENKIFLKILFIEHISFYHAFNEEKNSFIRKNISLLAEIKYSKEQNISVN